MSASLYISVQYKGIWNLITIYKNMERRSIFHLYITFQTLLRYNYLSINYIPLSYNYNFIPFIYYLYLIKI
jgi:hypothetical protein